MLILSTLGNRYLGDCCCRDIRVERPQKPPSKEFRLIMLQIPNKLLGMTFIRSIQDTRYLWDRCRHDILVQRPQKLLSNKTRLIFINIYRVINFCYLAMIAVCPTIIREQRSEQKQLRGVGRKQLREVGRKHLIERKRKRKKSFRNQPLEIFKLDIHQNDIIFSIKIFYACSISKKLSIDIFKV